MPYTIQKRTADGQWADMHNADGVGLGHPAYRTADTRVGPGNPITFPRRADAEEACRELRETIPPHIDQDYRVAVVEGSR